MIGIDSFNHSSVSPAKYSFKIHTKSAPIYTDMMLNIQKILISTQIKLKLNDTLQHFTKNIKRKFLPI